MNKKMRKTRGKIITNFFCLLVIILSMGACKKDALVVDTEKRYNQVNIEKPVDLLGGGVMLVLKPDGIADINPGGDIIWNGTYKISGNKISVKATQIDTKFNFTIISNEELRGSNGEVLKLVAN
jgi:hypothetical protein